MVFFVGIDPGTTVAYALIDLNNNNINNINNIKFYSQKEFSSDSLVQKLSKEGKITLIASDKKNLPYFVKSIAIKLGAITYTPKYDLLVKDKISLTRNINYLNSHERDALAAVLSAISFYKPKIDDIFNYLKKNNSLELFNLFLDKALKNQELSYSTILNNIKSNITHSNNSSPKTVSQAVLQSNLQSNSTSTSGDKLLNERNVIIKKLIEDNIILKKHNSELKQQINNLSKHNYGNKSNNQNLKRNKTKSEKELMEIISLKEKRLINIITKLKYSEDRLKQVSNLLSKLTDYVLRQDKFLLIKKLPDLRLLKEVNQNVLFVDNINIYTDNSLRLLSSDTIIISPVKITRKLKTILPCMYLDWTGLFKDIIDDIVIIKKDELDLKLNNIENLSSIIEDYKQNRLKELIE
jgi:predicted RNase H-like nuclease (RuvC/YqgF family)